MSNINFPYTPGQQYVRAQDFIPSDIAIKSARSVFENFAGGTASISFDTSNLTDTNRMFYNSASLTGVPLFDTSNVTSMSYMFYNCPYLLTVPLFDTSNVTDMSYMFAQDTVLTDIPQFDTSKVTSISNMLENCNNLIWIPALDCSSLKSFGYLFGYASGNTRLAHLAGFPNLGKQSSFSVNSSYGFNVLQNLTRQSLLNIFENLYDRAGAGFSVVNIKLHANALARLSEEDIAIATNKGWTIS